MCTGCSGRKLEMTAALVLGNFETFWTHSQTLVMQQTSTPGHFPCESQCQLENDHVKTKDSNPWPCQFFFTLLCLWLHWKHQDLGLNPRWFLLIEFIRKERIYNLLIHYYWSSCVKRKGAVNLHLIEICILITSIESIIPVIWEVKLEESQVQCQPQELSPKQLRETLSPNKIKKGLGMWLSD